MCVLFLVTLVKLNSIHPVKAACHEFSYSMHPVKAVCYEFSKSIHPVKTACYEFNNSIHAPIYHKKCTVDRSKHVFIINIYF